MHYSVSILVLQSSEEEDNSCCFAIIVLQLYCYYKYSVALPHGIGARSLILISLLNPKTENLIMSLRNDIVRFVF